MTQAYAEDIWRSLTLHVFPSLGTTPISQINAQREDLDDSSRAHEEATCARRTTNRTRMGHAADLGHAEFKAGLLAAKIIADPLAPPALQEVARMPTGAAVAEVVNHRREVRELAGGVGPRCFFFVPGMNTCTGASPEWTLITAQGNADNQEHRPCR